MEAKIESIHEQAEFHIRNAQNNLCKPHEDVVPYSVYHSAHNAVICYLSAYLMRHGRELPSPFTTVNLLTLCKEVDPHFEELQLESFYHPIETQDTWMSLEMAQEYLNRAESVKAMVNQLTFQL